MHGGIPASPCVLMVVVTTSPSSSCPQALFAGCELGLFDLLAGGTLGVGPVSGRLGLSVRGTQRLLDVLVALRLLGATPGPEGERECVHCGGTYMGDGHRLGRLPLQEVLRQYRKWFLPGRN